MRARPTIGVAGGSFGAKVLVPALREAGFEVVALACSHAARSAELAAAAAVPVALAGWADLVATPGLEAVALALPPRDGQEAVEAALAAGLPVFMEKPLGVDPVRGRRAADVAASAAIPTALDFEYAELLPFQTLARVVREETLGELREVEAVWHSRSAALARRDWGWKTDLSAGGGALSIYASHLLYMADHLLAAPGRPGPSVRDAVLENDLTAAFAPQGSAPADERCRLVLASGSGVRARLHVDLAARGELFQEWVLRFARGTATLSNRESGRLAGFRLTLAGPDGQVVEVVDDPVAEEGGLDVLVARLGRRFRAALEGGDPCRPGLADGARVQELIADARARADAGRG